MKKYVTLNHVLIYVPDHDDVPSSALAAASAEENIYVAPNQVYIVADSPPEGCLDVETRPHTLAVVKGGQWVLDDTAVAVQPGSTQSGNVRTTHFLRNLLTLPVYGSMEVAETGLTAKFSAGIATEQDIQLLGLFRAAKAWLNSSPSLSLDDPMVSQVLDACIAIPKIGLTVADKERILRNEAKA